jgi:hypothetical protein
LNVNPATKSPFFSRRQTHFEGVTRLSTPGKGILVELTMTELWLSDVSTCIFRSLPCFFSNSALRS